MQTHHDACIHTHMHACTKVHAHRMYVYHSHYFTIACPGPSLSHGITWPTTAVNGMVRTRCARIHPSFGYGPIVTRRCLDGGVWDTPDLSRCSVTVKSNSLIVYSTYLRARSSRDVRQRSSNITNNVSFFCIMITVAM